MQDRNISTFPPKSLLTDCFLLLLRQCQMEAKTCIKLYLADQVFLWTNKTREITALDAILYKTSRKQSFHTTSNFNLKPTQMQRSRGRASAGMVECPGTTWAVAESGISSVEGAVPPSNPASAPKGTVFKIVQKNVISWQSCQTPHAKKH